ncbi:MAG TPA: hypothetical protein VG939_13440 [Caulobacteraceae bacterium]|nr:hypothetical protein [Caulobacteraceae bacterium]
MARKPNYRFERQERDRLKAAKMAEKAAARLAARERGETPAADDADLTTPGSEDGPGPDSEH